MTDASCRHIDKILKLERAIIQDHIAKHKWCNHIKETDKAIVDFVHKFAWLMREIYCGSMCPYKEECAVNDAFRKAFLEDITDREMREYVKFAYGQEDKDLIKLKLHVIKHDIATHKWLNKIGNYESAVRDFLQKFGWLIFEIYKRTKEKDSNGNRR